MVGSASELVDRRVRALAHLVPVHDLERNKNSSAGGRDWKPYDTKLLAVTAIDTVVATTGLHGVAGVPRDEMVAAVATEASRCAPDRDEREHRAVAEWVLRSMLNHGEQGVAHQISMVDVVADYAQEQLAVRVLFETLAPDGTVLVNVDPATVTLMLIALDRNLEDAQVATDAVLEFQLRTGRLGDAANSARQSLTNVRLYRAEFSERLRTLRQDLRQVDWVGTVEPRLKSAIAHIQDRISVERALQDHARSVRVGDPSDTSEETRELRREASVVYDLMTDCLTTFAELQSDLLGARDVFREEQARQAFAPPAPIGTVDMHSDVLVPLLSGPASADGTADSVACALMGPVVPTLLAYHDLTDLLTRAPAARDDEPPVEFEDDLEDIEEFDRFGEAHWTLFDGLVGSLAGPVRLSSLLASAEDRAGGDDRFAAEMAVLLSLAALRAWHPVDGQFHPGLTAHDDGTALAHAAVALPDLLLTPTDADVVSAGRY